MLVDLVDQGHVDALLVEGTGLGGHRAHVAVAGRGDEVVRTDLDQALEGVRGVDHPAGVRPEVLRLVAGNAGGVDLGRVPAICHKPDDPDGGGERRLAVALAHLNVGRAEPPGRALVPAKETPDDERLGRLEDERLA